MKSDANGRGIFAEIAASMTPKQKRGACSVLMALAAAWYLTMASFFLLGFLCAASLFSNPAQEGAIGRGFAGLLFILLAGIMANATHERPSIDG